MSIDMRAGRSVPAWGVVFSIERSRKHSGSDARNYLDLSETDGRAGAAENRSGRQKPDYGNFHRALGGMIKRAARWHADVLVS